MPLVICDPAKDSEEAASFPRAPPLLYSRYPVVPDPTVVVPTVTLVAAPPVELIVWLGQVPEMVTLLPATRLGEDVPVPPFATDTGVDRFTVTVPDVPPPKSPVPAVTPVIEPLLPDASCDHVPDTYCQTPVALR